MKNKFLKILSALILAAALLVGCKTTKDVATTGQLDPSAVNELIENIHAKHSDFKTFSARFSAQTKFKNSEHFFNGSLRIVKDSAIYISATLPIVSEVARVVITPDSLKFINRLESVYFVGKIDYLNKLIGADVDYQMLEALLLGNDFGHFSHSNLMVSTEADVFVLNSANRVPFGNPWATPLENRMWVNAKNFRIQQNIFMDGLENRMIRANYKNHRMVQEQMVPLSVEMFFSEPSNSLFFSLDLSRVSLDSEVAISFSVPQGYKPMVL